MDIKSELVSIVKDYTDVPVDELDSNSSLKSLGLNSYIILSMISEIEDRFSISIPDNDLYSFKTLDDITGYISSKTA